MEIKNHFKKLLMMFVLLVISSFFLKPNLVFAESLSFQVTPEMPVAQRQNVAGYFDLIAAPNTTTNLKMQIKNVTAKSIDLQVTPVSLQTSNAGQLDYSLKQKSDATLVYDLAKLVNGQRKITVPAKSTITYAVQLTMPSQDYDGIIAGGLLFQDESKKIAKTESNFSIVNQLQYALPIVVRNENKTWQPRLTLGQPKIAQINSQNKLQIKVNNPSGTFVNQLRIEMAATNLATKKNYQQTSDQMQMAPNSHFEFQHALPNNLPAGTYQVKTRAYYVMDEQGKYQAQNGKTYRYRQLNTKKITITAAKSRQLKQKIRHSRTGSRTWIIYLIAGLVILLVLLVIGLSTYIIYQKRRQRK